MPPLLEGPVPVLLAAFPVSHRHLLPQVGFNTSPQPVPCQGSAVPAMLPAPSPCFWVLQLLPAALRCHKAQAVGLWVWGHCHPCPRASHGDCS